MTVLTARDEVGASWYMDKVKETYRLYHVRSWLPLEPLS